MFIAACAAAASLDASDVTGVKPAAFAAAMFAIAVL
jgi:hypothetical protein